MNKTFRKIGTWIGVLLLLVVGMVTTGCATNESRVEAAQVRIANNQNVAVAWNFYINKGFSEEAVAGILGNYMRESNMNPAIEEKGNKIGYGLAQWSFTRRTNLENYAKRNGLAVSNIYTQLNFSILEMSTVTNFGGLGLQGFKNLKDVNYATEIFENHFEKPGVKASAERKAYAKAIYNQYAGK